MKNKTKKIGLIAGEGDLPENIIAKYLNDAKEIFVISIGKTKPPSLEKTPHIVLNIASVGKAIKILRKNNVTDIVFAGGIKRPNFSKLRPDTGGIKLLAKISKAKLLGDNSLLAIVIKFFEDSGFNILGAEEVLDDILMPKGVLGKIKPNDLSLKEIDFGTDISRSIGILDIGQSVIVRQAVVIGVEASEGTDELIRRCRELLKNGQKGVLVKTKKPNQDERIDLPTIGTTTIENAFNSNLKGIALEAKTALILNKDEVIKTADELGIFVVGI